MCQAVLSSLCMLAHLTYTEGMLDEKKLSCIRARLIKGDLKTDIFSKKKFCEFSKIGKSDNSIIYALIRTFFGRTLSVIFLLKSSWYG